MQCVRVSFRRFHTVEHSMEFTKFLYHEFLKNFREKNFFSKHFTVKVISRNYTQVIQKFRKLHTVCGKIDVAIKIIKLRIFRNVLKEL